MLCAGLKFLTVGSALMHEKLVAGGIYQATLVLKLTMHVWLGRELEISCIMQQGE